MAVSRGIVIVSTTNRCAGPVNGPTTSVLGAAQLASTAQPAILIAAAKTIRVNVRVVTMPNEGFV